MNAHFFLCMSIVTWQVKCLMLGFSRASARKCAVPFSALFSSKMFSWNEAKSVFFFSSRVKKRRLRVLAHTRPTLLFFLEEWGVKLPTKIVFYFRRQKLFWFRAKKTKSKWDAHKKEEKQLFFFIHIHALRKRNTHTHTLSLSRVRACHGVSSSYTERACRLSCRKSLLLARK